MSGGRFDGNINYWSPEKDPKVEEAGLALTSSGGIAEITNLDPVADVSGSLDGKTFILQDSAGSVAFWIDIDNSGTVEPAEAIAADRSVEITTIATDDTAATIQGLLVTAIGNDSEFSAAGGGGNSVDITDAAAGARPDASASTSGFTLTESTPGITPVYFVGANSILRIIPSVDTHLKFLDNVSIAVPATTANTLLKADVEYFVSSGTRKFLNLTNTSGNVVKLTQKGNTRRETKLK